MPRLQGVAAMRAFIRVTIAGYLLLASTISSGESCKQTFTGTWDWTTSPQSRTFSIKLKQQGDKISGQYCAVAQNGNRVDCDDEDNSNIHGRIEVGAMSATVDFFVFLWGIKWKGAA